MSVKTLKFRLSHPLNKQSLNYKTSVAYFQL